MFHQLIEKRHKWGWNKAPHYFLFSNLLFQHLQKNQRMRLCVSLPYLILTHPRLLGLCLGWARLQVISPGICLCPTCVGTGLPASPIDQPPPGENSLPGRCMGRHSGAEPTGWAEPTLRAHRWSVAIRNGTFRGHSSKLWAWPKPTLHLLCSYRQTLLSWSQANSCHKQSISFLKVKQTNRAGDYNWLTEGQETWEAGLLERKALVLRSPVISNNKTYRNLWGKKK